MGGTALARAPSVSAAEGPGGGSAALDAALLAAHAAGDERALVRLYADAARAAELARDVDRACFFLTQAYVFALASGASEAGALHARLLAHGREE
jgi:hypothetical protein